MRMDLPAVRFPIQLAAVALCLASCTMSPRTLPTSRTAQTSRTAPDATDPSLPETPIPAHAVIGVEEHHLDPEFWVRQQSEADRPILDASAIEAENAKLQQLDPSVYAIEQLPATLTTDQVKSWITKLSHRPAAPLFDENGLEVGTGRLDALADSLNLGAIPSSQQSHYGLVVKRADLRTFPTYQRVFTSRVDHDIDRFQESALFPGAPVLIAHESRDHHWWFVVSSLYAAWIEKDYVAQGSAQQVFGYIHKTPYLVITGSTGHTVFTPEQPQVSALQLDMGVRVPVLTDWPANRPVNGEHPYTAHVIELPIRMSDGSLAFSPALLQKTVDTAPGYLTLTRANLLRQSFKFLGERYGWGHSYDARDCSGFVSEIYRSFGVQLPRNTHDQGVSPALNRVSFTSSDSHEFRIAALRDVQVGDLIYIPGHVMMVIGYDHGVPYVIHDTVGISYRGTAGEIEHVRLNGVSVTPLTQLLLGEGQPLIDRIYSIQRIRPVRRP
jgi:cell wall-associated NlpC family hydrolase